MKMISYACNREDVLLNRVFAGQNRGTYVDVGGYHPVYASLTCHFHRQGWSGVNVEPIPELFAAFLAERPHDVNLNVGLSDRAGQRTFYEVADEKGLSTFVAEQGEAYRRAGRNVVERTLPVVTLAEVCDRHVKGTIDFLSIDVEGHERAVLSGGDWRRWRPRLVVIEATRPHSTVPTHHLWEDLILAADYRLAIFDGLNRYYIRAEDPELLPRLAVPVNVFDVHEPFEHNWKITSLEAALAQTQAQLRQAEVAVQELSLRLNCLQRPFTRIGGRVAWRTGRVLWRAVRRLIA